MSEHILETCYSLKEAIQVIKERLTETDQKRMEMWNSYKENMPEKVQEETMEMKYWSDKLYLVYRNDYYSDECWLFKSEYDIECWLEGKWHDWDLWDYHDVNTFLEETLVIWEFHRNVCIERWPNLYDESKLFIDGWSRKREHATFEVQPSFSIG